MNMDESVFMIMKFSSSSGVKRTGSDGSRYIIQRMSTQQGVREAEIRKEEKDWEPQVQYLPGLYPSRKAARAEIEEIVLVEKIMES